MTRATIEVPLHEASTLRVLVSYAKVSAASDQKFWAEQAEKSNNPDFARVCRSRVNDYVAMAEWADNMLKLLEGK